MQLLFIFLLLIVVSPANAVTVTQVIDGDTLVANDGKQVRLYGVDCPERGQPGGKDAAQTVSRLIQGEIQLKVLYSDRYGRSVAIVTLEDGNTLQEELLQKGMVWVAPRYCKRPECNHWKELEQGARHVQLGIRRDEHAVAPWEWRKRRRNRGL